MAKNTDKRGEVEDDGWGTESGLKDEFSGVVKRAYFGTNEKYQNGETAMLKLEVEDDEDGEEITVEIPCGKTWELADSKGREVEYPGKPNKKFNERCSYGMMIDLAMMKNSETHDNGIAGFDLMPVIRKRGRPTVAKIWEGLRFEFKRYTFHYGKTTETDEYGEEKEVDMKSKRVFPVAYLGLEGEDKPAKSSKKPARDDDDEDEDEKPVKKSRKPAKEDDEDEPAPKKGKAKEPARDEDDDEDEPAPKKKAAKKPADDEDDDAEEPPAKKSKSKGKRGPLARSLDPDTMAKIDKIFAKHHADHARFMDACLVLPEAEDDADLLAMISDEDQLFAELLDERGE